MTVERKLITTVFLVIVSCSKKIDPSIIATVGDSYITSTEYISAYSDRLIKTQVKDSEFERERMLNELIRTKLFAQGARMKNLSLDSSANSMVELSRDQALRDALYKKFIGSECIFSTKYLEDRLFFKSKCKLNTKIIEELARK